MQGRLAEVHDLNWSEFLKRPVPVLNDAQAALLGEVWIGAARGSANVMLLTLGTGVGGALMVDGKLLKGFSGRAGHLGHISLNPDGELDIVNTPGSFETTHELVAGFEAGDTEAARAWLTSIRSLAAAIASLINVVDPEVVVIGGGIAQASYESLREPLARELERFEWRPFGRGVRIVAAHCGSFAGAVGAAKNALDKIEL
jgi:glucokinase